MMVLSQALPDVACGKPWRSSDIVPSTSGLQNPVCIRWYPSSSQVGKLTVGQRRDAAGAWIRLGIPPPCSCPSHAVRERQAARSRTIGPLTRPEQSCPVGRQLRCCWSRSLPWFGSKMSSTVQDLSWDCPVLSPSPVEREMALRDVYLKVTCIWDGRRDADWSG
jgi:hypothetical protein